DVPSLDDLVARDREHDCEGFGAHRICVKVAGVANLPTRFGQFRVVAFWNNQDGKEHLALVHGDVLGRENVMTRLHSECLTDDAREYALAAHMLASLTLRSVRLLTNNPRKLSELERYGIRVAERVPHVIPANEHNRAYLQTKAERSGHLIAFSEETSSAEQDE